MNSIISLFCRSLKFLIYWKHSQWIHRLMIIIVGDKRYYSVLSWIESACLTSISTNSESTDDSIVFLMFDGRIEQAGLADNLRASASVYYLCKSLNKKFKIIFNYPFNLEKYLVPNHYNWLYEEQNRLHLSEHAQDVVAASYRSVFIESNEKLQQGYLEKKITDTKYTITRLYTNTYCFDNIFYESYHDLFKPSESLDMLIKEQLSLIGGKFVSVSFRFANLLGDLDDNYGYELSEEEKVNTILKCSSAVDSIYQSNGGCRVLVTSDSKRFITEIQQNREYVYVIPGNIGHVGHNGDDNVVLKTFLDLYVISYADKVHMVRTPIMYRSGFAHRAAMIGNKPFKEIIV